MKIELEIASVKIKDFDPNGTLCGAIIGCPVLSDGELLPCTLCNKFLGTDKDYTEETYNELRRKINGH